MTRVAVIGGGAAGLAAAIEAAYDGAHVVLFEASDRVGKSILATGNGRCNISNARVSAADYNRPEFVQEAFDALGPEAVQQFFADAGLLVFEEDEGRMYPYSNKAATVLDALRLTASEAGVEERTQAKVNMVEPAHGGNGWCVHVVQGEREHFDAVIIAVGGAPAKGLIPTDVPFKTCRPMLAPLKTDTENIKGLSGIRVRARLYLDEDPTDLRDAWLDVVDPEFEAHYAGPEEQGEVLFRDYGISGIAAFDMSRHVRPGQMVFMDLAPDLDPQDKVDFIYDQAMAHPDRTAEQVMAGMLPARVARAVVVAAGIDPDEPIVAEQEAVVLAMVTESFGMTVHGIADAKQAQVTRGGYAVRAFDARTMECLAYPGLFVAGEALDIDGRCGGYNLHWAWTSGMLAGRAAAGKGSNAKDSNAKGKAGASSRPSGAPQDGARVRLSLSGK